MKTDRAFDLGWAAFIARTILGFIVVFSGAARFQLGYDKYVHLVGAIPYASAMGSAVLFNVVTAEALLEIVLGGLLLVGCRTRLAALGTGILLLVINAGFGIAGLAANAAAFSVSRAGFGPFGPTAQSGMFQSLYAFPRAWLVAFLLLLPATADRYSWDRLWRGTIVRIDDARARAWAIFVVRVLVASGWFIASINKVFLWGAGEHARQLFVTPYAGTWIGHPPFGGVWLLWTLGYLIPFFELVFSFLLLLGLWTRASAVILGLILSLVSFGHLVPAPVGFIIGLFNGLILPRAAGLIITLIFPPEADRYSLSQLLLRRRANKSEDTTRSAANVAARHH